LKGVCGLYKKGQKRKEKKKKKRKVEAACDFLWVFEILPTFKE
jgi:hypothetical protein